MAATLAILLAVAIPSFVRTAQRLHAEQTAFSLTQLLRYAHERSVTHSEVIVWVWDDGIRRVHLEVLSDDGEGVRLTERFAQSAALREDVTVSLTREDVPVDRVRFFPDGTSEATTLLVSHRGRVYTVTVDGTTSQAVLTTGSSP